MLPPSRRWSPLLAAFALACTAPEANEAPETQRSTRAMAGEDLTVALFEAPRVRPATGPAWLRVRFCNEGATRAPRVRAYASTDATVTTADVSLGNFQSWFLQDGDCWDSYMQANLTAPGLPTSGDVFLAAIVDPDDDVMEGDETNNVSPVRAVSVSPLVDADVVRFDRRERRGSDDVFEIEVCNRGDVPTPAGATVEIVDSPTRDPVYPDFSLPVLVAHDLPRLGEADCAVLQARLPSMLPNFGRFLVARVIAAGGVDAGGAQRDAVASITGNLDASLRNVRATPAGRDTWVEGEICYDGPASAPTTLHAYWAPTADFSNFIGGGFGVVTPAVLQWDHALPGCTPFEVLVPESTTSSQFPYLGVILDVGNVGSDADPANNGVSVRRPTQAGEANVAITDVRVPTFTYNSSGDTLFARVCNFGTATSPTTDVRLDLTVFPGLALAQSASSPAYDSSFVPPLAPSECTEVGLRSTAQGPGAFDRTFAGYLSLTLDPADAIAEVDETDNVYVAGPVFPTGSAEIVVRQLRVDRRTLVPTVVYCNQGSAAAVPGAFEFDVLRAPTAGLDGTLRDGAAGFTDIASLGAGACRTQTLAAVSATGARPLYLQGGRVDRTSNPRPALAGARSVPFVPGSPEIVDVAWQGDAPTFPQLVVTACRTSAAPTSASFGLYQSVYPRLDDTRSSSFVANLTANLTASQCASAQTSAANAPGGVGQAPTYTTLGLLTAHGPRPTLPIADVSVSNLRVAARAPTGAFEYEVDVCVTGPRNPQPLDITVDLFESTDPSVARPRSTFAAPALASVTTAVVTNACQTVTLSAFVTHDRFVFAHANRSPSPGPWTDDVPDNDITEAQRVFLPNATNCGNGFVNAYPNARDEECDDGNTVSGDGCSADCALECGNGILEPAEQCDDGNRTDFDGCSATCAREGCGDSRVQWAQGERCDDGNTANGDGCDSACQPELCGNGVPDPGELCDDGNLVDGDGCSALCETEICGDLIVNGTEECDDGNQFHDDGCDMCRLEVCGDGTRQSNEGCDDGNTTDGDGCNASCQIEFCGDLIVNNAGTETCDDGNVFFNDGCYQCQLEVCGDGIQNNGNEGCDDGNTADGDGCNASCQPELCGDGLVNNAGAETCDDGNLVNDDGCNAQCQIEFCGDGIRNNGTEGCDDGNATPGDGCDASCQPEFCGDFLVNNVSETCDDGNLTPGDGCNALCQVETCGDGLVNNAGAEACDDGNTTDGDGCDAACQVEICGDGLVNNAGAETCDDGNLTPGDGCDAACQVETCGDGLVNNAGAEACDDGNTTDGDGCDAACQVEICGDGLVNNAGAEACDDGNLTPGDGCDAACQVETCGDGLVNNAGAEACDDGNTTDGDGCDAACQVEICGDGLVNNAGAEACDDGNLTPGDGCDAACQVETCGDGLVNNAGAEACDDGNTTDGDGCDAACQVETCGDGLVNNAGAEACDDGNTTDGDGCDAACQVETCGDGLVNNAGAEACDDGNTTDGDGCSATCQIEVTNVCGDGIVGGGESCDDGNLLDGDGCDSYCLTTPVRGESNQDYGEVLRVPVGAASPLNPPNAFTFSMWARFPTQLYEAVAHRWDDGGQSWWLGHFHYRRMSFAIAQSTSGAGGFGVDFATQVNLGEWHHYTVTYDAGEAHVYLDGQLDDGTVNGPLPTNLTAGTSPLYIGQDSYAGDVGNVMFFDRALSATEVGNVYCTLSGSPAQCACQAPTRACADADASQIPGIVAHWPLSQGPQDVIGGFDAEEVNGPFNYQRRDPLPSVPDGGVPPDSGVLPDAGFPDTGVPPDAGFPDTGVPPDAGFPDTGVLPDAGFPDTGVPPDAGFPDTGVPPDAGFPDTGVPPDAGFPDSGVLPDAGFPDSGVLPDAGFAPDAGALPDAGSLPDTGPVYGPTSFATFDAAQAQHLSVPVGPGSPLDANAFSLAMWMQMPTRWAAVANRWDEGGQVWWFGHYTPGYMSLGVAQSTSGAGGTGHEFATPMVEGQWYHVIVTYEAGVVRLYRDGQPDDGATFGTIPAQLTGGSSPLYIGQSIMNGSVGHVLYYDRALTPAEAADVACAFSSAPRSCTCGADQHVCGVTDVTALPGLVSYWPLGASGADLVGGQDLTETNGPISFTQP